MYLVSRTRTVKPGKLAEGMAIWKQSKAHVKRITGRDVAIALPVFGLPAGTPTAAMAVEGRADWLSVLDALRADGAVAAIEQEADIFEGPGDDVIRMIIDLNGYDPTTFPAFGQVWTSQFDHWRFDEALAWATKVAAHVTTLTSVPVIVLADAYGEFGTIAWIAPLSSAAQADQLNEAMLADAPWRQLLLEADGLFVPSTTKVWLNRTF